ncbi:MAG: hypothetical protein U0797_06380 [Gemmataceae bacterium]
MLADHWPAAALALAGLLTLLAAWRRGKILLFVGVGLLLLAGGSAVPYAVASWLAIGAAAGLGVMSAILLLSGWWSRPVALALASVGSVGW